MVPYLTRGQAAAPVVEYFLVRETPSEAKFWECIWEIRRTQYSTRFATESCRGENQVKNTISETSTTVSYTHLTLPTKRIV